MADELKTPESDVSEWTPARIAALECVDRGEGLKPCHVYVDGSGKCQCGHGPDLTERRMK